MAYKTAIQRLKVAKMANKSIKTITSIPTSYTRAGKVIVTTSGRSMPAVNPIKNTITYERQRNY